MVALVLRLGLVPGRVIHALLLIISVSSRNLTVLRREVTVVWETPGASNRYLAPEPRL